MAKQILKLSDLVGKTVKSVVESTQPDHVVGTRYIELHFTDGTLLEITRSGYADDFSNFEMEVSK
jgi:hypothetical protein